MLLLLALLSCARHAPDPGLPVADLATLVPAHVPDRAGWAADVRAALVAADQVPDAEHACRVLAVVEQESGFDPDPAVPGLARIVEDRLDEELSRLGPLKGPVREELLGPFEDRLAAVRTEQELDRLFREIVAYHEDRAPGVVSGAVRLLLPGLQERLDPIDTAGSMQVSVAFARALDPKLDAEVVRGQLYTRHGGLRYGTARLFVVGDAYEDPVHAFADYNAGPFASRNAAFQEVVADLTGAELAPDGDLLTWKPNGRPSRHDGETLRALLAWREADAPDLSERRLRADLRLEKERAFEGTETWRRVRDQWAAEHGKEPPYARIPDITLDSPKLKGDWTTAAFAQRVDRRYHQCLGRTPGRS